MPKREEWLDIMIEIGKIKRKYDLTGNELCWANNLVTDATKEWLKQELVLNRRLSMKSINIIVQIKRLMI